VSRCSSRAEHVDPGGGELDRQREPVEPRADLGDRGGVLVAHAEVGLGSLRPLDEQGHRLVLGERLQAREVRRVGHGQRRDEVLALPVDPQGAAARHEHDELRGCAQQLAHQRGGIGELLEVVQDEEEPPATKVLAEGGHRVQAAAVGEAELMGDRSRDELRVPDGAERHEEDPIGEGVCHAGGHLERQPGLAGPARSGEREEPRLADERRHLAELALAAQEAGDLRGQVVRRGIERPERREVRREAGNDELLDVLRSREVLQPSLAEVTERHPFGQRGLGEDPGRFAQEDLAAVPRRADPRRSVHLEAHVVVPGNRRLTRVQAHPHADLRALGPSVIGQAPLGGDGGVHRAGCRREGDEEGVALRSDLATASRGHGGANDLPVLVEQGRPARSQALGEPGRPLDITEQERDGPRRQARHAMGGPDCVAPSFTRIGANDKGWPPHVRSVPG
jgi:hypothetical protein